MAASKAFDYIIECVKSSNLNFCVQLSPFSANISIKKTLVKDKSGDYLKPQVPDPYLLKKHVIEITDLSKKVKDLENVIDALQLRLMQSDKDCKHAYDIIRDLESNLQIKQENIDVKEYNLETEIENKSSEINNLYDVNKQLQNQSETLEVSLQEHKKEIHDLKKCLQNSRCAANKLNKELNETRTNFDKEFRDIIKKSRSEIKAWKRDLGRERSEKIRVEKKLTTVDNLVKKIQSKIVKSVSSQTMGSIDLPYMVTEPLPPIFGSQLCYRSKPIPYIAKSLPNLSTLSWVRVTEEDFMVDAAEQAINELYDNEVNEFYKDAKEKAGAIRQVYEANCIGKLFESD